jgi:uncharacterized repeat protein (TIGR01451 family)
MKKVFLLFAIVFFLQNITLPQQNPIRIVCNAPYMQSDCDVDGDYIVWKDGRDLQTHIYLYRISDSTTTKITSVNSTKGNPKISGNRVVWSDNRNGNSDIYNYRIDLPQLGDYPLIDFPRDQFAPDIDGEKLVYIDSYESFQGNLFLYDMATINLKQITTNEMGNANSPSIDNYIIAFKLDADICMYNINTDEIVTVCDNPYYKQNPVVAGKRIIWEDERNGNTDLYMFIYQYYIGQPGLPNLYDYPLSYFLEKYLSTPSAQTHPHLYDNKLVFSDDRSGNNDVYLYDFRGHYYLRGTLTKISSSDLDENDPVIYDDKIVWWDDKDPNPYIISNADVYLWQRPQGADLAVDISTEENEVQAGQYITYSISVTNFGPMPAINTVVLDTFSTRLNILSAFSDAGIISLNGQVVTCNIGDLPADSTVTVTVNARALIEGLAFSNATVTGSEIDYVQINNIDNHSLRIKLIQSSLLANGINPILKIDSFGNIHIVYNSEGSFLKYITNKYGSWASHILSDSVYFSKYDLDVDQFGNVHVCYAKGDGFSENSLYYINKIGSYWNDPLIIEINAQACASPEINIDQNNSVHLAYGSSRFMGNLFYITNKTGAWVSSEISPFYNDFSMDIDSDGFIHFAMYREFTFNSLVGGGPNYITNSPDSIWKPSETIEQGWFGGQMETLSIDIAIDNTNTPHVSYVGVFNSDNKENYKYAKKIAGVWQNEFVDIGAFQGGANAIAVDNNNAPILIYVQPENNHLVFSKKVANNFETHYIDHLQFHPGLLEFDLTTDSNDFLHIVYTKNENIYYGTNAEYTVHYGGGGDENGGYFFANSTASGSGSPSQPTYEWIDPILAGHTEVTTWSNGNGDNSYFGPVNIGYTIPFFTRHYNELFISTNGYLAFETGFDITAEHATIPYPVVPNNIAAACAMDLNVDNTMHPDAHVYYGGNSSQYVVTYIHAYDNSSSTEYITFQIILYPNGNIKYQYNPDETTNPVPVSITDDALIGIENIWGTRGISYRNNGAGGPIFGSPMALMFGFNNQVLPVEIIESGIVDDYKLEQNYPNPFNPSTTIRYNVLVSGRVTLKIYDLLGKEIKTLVNEDQINGKYQTVWNGENNFGSKVSSGVYFYQLKAGDFIHTKKMIYLK